jgi:hypothetical protein
MSSERKWVLAHQNCSLHDVVVWEVEGPNFWDEKRVFHFENLEKFFEFLTQNWASAPAAIQRVGVMTEMAGG